jgi:site-specific DNA-methyltransferase (adenine-specific)
MNSEVRNIDCMIGMAEYPDKYFDLAIVDPPYGIGIADWDTINQKPTPEYFDELFRISKNQIIWGGNYFNLPHSQVTQKPVDVYRYLLINYAKEGDKILDTHLGSGSSRIAAYDCGFDFTGFEFDKDYFDAAEKRFKNHIKQLTFEFV